MVPRRATVRLAIGFLLAMVGSGAHAEWGVLEPSELVKKTDVIVVAVLCDAKEMTVDGIDYGQGVLKINEVLWPSDFKATELSLHWKNNSGMVSPRIDHRPNADTPAVWLLTAGPDSTVRADYPGRVLLLDRVNMQDWILKLSTLTKEPSYAQKVLALEAFAHRGNPPGDNGE